MPNLVEKLLAKAASRGAENLDIEAFAPVVENLIISLGGSVTSEEQWGVQVPAPGGEHHVGVVLDEDDAQRKAEEWGGIVVKRTVSTTVIPTPWTEPE